MKAKAIDIRNLKTLGSLSKRNKAEIAQVIDLYTDRKIERFDTARNMINDLSSSGKTKQKTGLDKLEFYNNQYVPRNNSLNSTISPGSNRFIKPTPEEMQKLHVKKKRETIQKRKHKLASLVSLINAPAVWKIGDMNRPATYLCII